MEIKTTDSRQLPSRRTGPAPVRRDDLEALHRRDHHGLLPRQRARRERGLAPEKHLTGHQGAWTTAGGPRGARAAEVYSHHDKLLPF